MSGFSDYDEAYVGVGEFDSEDGHSLSGPFPIEQIENLTVVVLSRDVEEASEFDADAAVTTWNDELHVHGPGDKIKRLRHRLDLDGCFTSVDKHRPNNYRLRILEDSEEVREIVDRHFQDVNWVLA